MRFCGRFKPNRPYSFGDDTASPEGSIVLIDPPQVGFERDKVCENTKPLTDV